MRELRIEANQAEWERPPATCWLVQEVQRRPRSRGRRVRGHALVVDDDPEVRRALSRALGPELELHSAASVSEARAIISGLSDLSLAFVDLNLPDGSGEQVLELLGKWPDAIAVLISGALPAGPARANPLKNRALANLVLAKPIAPRVVDALKRAALASSK